jgi:cysteine synthase A
MSSVKDRLALAVIEDAERSGELKPGQTVVEATSGNTGIALAMVCAVKGHPFVAVMAESFSKERRQLMRCLGAKLVLTPAALRGTGMVSKAKELAEKNGWFLTRQFDNFANVDYHAKTTAAEILSDFRSDRLDYFVSGWGTGGTISGVARTLKAALPDCKVVCVEPANAAVLQGEEWHPHPIQGWVPDFVPTILDANRGRIDQFVKVTGDEAMACARNLACKEGIFVGVSSGATFAGALELAKTVPEGSTMVVMLPDTGERYLSTPLWANCLYDGSDEVEPKEEK